VATPRNTKSQAESTGPSVPVQEKSCLQSSRDARLHVPEQKPSSPCPAPRKHLAQPTDQGGTHGWDNTFWVQSFVGMAWFSCVSSTMHTMHNSLREMRWITDIISVCFSYKFSTNCAFAFKKNIFLTYSGLG